MDLTWKQRLGISFVLMAVVALIGTDLWNEWGAGTSLKHVAVEVVIALSALIALILFWVQNIRLRRRMARVHEDAQKWKNENAQLLRGLGEAIERQFAQWNLTSSEKEIGIMLLKGLSLKEIAQVRNTSERTVRQQSTQIYDKAGLGGRAELSAFFLEDLMLPTERS